VVEIKRVPSSFDSLNSRDSLLEPAGRRDAMHVTGQTREC